jgi:hypothetical protein
MNTPDLIILCQPITSAFATLGHDFATFLMRGGHLRIERQHIAYWQIYFRKVLVQSFIAFSFY